MLLKKNISLFTLDLRNNPGFTPEIAKEFLQKLIFNMKNFKTKKRFEKIEEIKEEEEKSLSEFYKNSDNLHLPSQNSFQEATLSFGDHQDSISFKKQGLFQNVSAVKTKP